jgi:sugar lactone lactonase YvrE
VAGADNLRVGTVAGSGSASFANGLGAVASFSSPKGVAIDASGLAYVADLANNRVRHINMSTGAVTMLAGSGTAASTDGTGTAAAFSSPSSLALDGLGNLYVTDSGTHRIRKVVLATREVTTAAGSGVAAYLDGVGLAAAFDNPQGIACDAVGNAYVADTNNKRVRKMVLSTGAVTTLAGTTGASTSNGIGSNAGFAGPRNVAVDTSGTLLFVSDGNKIRQIMIATQAVTTLAGTTSSVAADGIGTTAGFSTPWGLVVDSSGNLFVGDHGSSLIRKVVIATKAVTTLAGSGADSWADGFGTNAAFNQPAGLAIDARGNLLVADSLNHRVRSLLATEPCPAGMYCAPGADTVACTPGYHCAAGADRKPCAQGFFCPSGSSSAMQVACPAGAFDCPAGASAPVSIACAAGYGLL